MSTLLRRAGWTVVLFMLWLLFAQSFHWQSMITGLVVSAIVVAMNHDLLLSLSTDLHVNMRSITPWTAWVGLLIIEIFKSGWQVAKLAFSRKLILDPGYITHQTGLKEPMMRVSLANSITLTPGTLTVEAPATGEFVIHVLTGEAGEGLKDWHIEKRLAEIEGMR